MTNIKEQYMLAMEYAKAGKYKQALRAIDGLDHPKVNDLRMRINIAMKANSQPPVWARFGSVVLVIVIASAVAIWANDAIYSLRSTNEAGRTVQVAVVFFGLIFLLGYLSRKVLRAVF